MTQPKKQEFVTISIPTTAKQRNLINQAAKRQRRSRSDFMLAASCREAEDILVDQAFLMVNVETLQDMLVKPLPSPNELRRLSNPQAS